MHATTAASAFAASRAGLAWPAGLGLDPEAASRSIALRRATAQWLTEGGDARICLNPDGVNLYGCGPRPDPALLAWGSSTASVVSDAGFEAACRLLSRLHSQESSLAQEAQRIRSTLAQMTGAERVAGTQLLLAASGTDIHLIAHQLLAGSRQGALQVVMIEPAETGSGLPEALAGHHFAGHTCSGQPVPRGMPVGATPGQPPISVAMRRADGSLRPEHEVDQAVETAVRKVVQAGGRCLLIVTDQSKTGLLAPTPNAASRLLARYPDALDVLVDGCQFRLSPDTVVAYLQRGFLVALTGSKFVTGPAFCGALLLPPLVAGRARVACLRPLQAYSCQAHWPADWGPVADDLPTQPNVGLLLRWEAALAELTPFAQLPDPFVADSLAQWGQVISQRLLQDPAFEPVPGRALARGMAHASWDQAQTIFPFLLRAGGRRDGDCLDHAQAQQLHRALQLTSPGAGRNTLRCQFGQPVACGTRDGRAVSALRICVSARHLVAASRHPQGMAPLIAQALQALDRLSSALA